MMGLNLKTNKQIKNSRKNVKSKWYRFRRDKQFYENLKKLENMFSKAECLRKVFPVKNKFEKKLKIWTRSHFFLFVEMGERSNCLDEKKDAVYERTACFSFRI